MYSAPFVLAWLTCSAFALAQEPSVEALKLRSEHGVTSPSVEGALELARALRRAGRTQEALAEAKKGLTLGQVDGGASLRLEMARIHAARSESRQALAQCRLLGAISGQAALGHACAAEAHLAWRRASEALDEVARAQAIDPTQYDAKVAEGIAHEMQVEDEHAERCFRDAVATAPARAEGHAALGRLLARTGRIEAAIESLKRALALDAESPDVRFELAALLGPNEAGARELEAVVKARPTHAAAVHRLLELYGQLKRPDDVRRVAALAFRIDANDPHAHVALGRLALAEGNVELAVTEARKASAKAHALASAKLLLGDALLARGELDPALEAYQAALMLDRRDAAPLVRASEACRLSGRVTTARAYAVKASQDFPEDPRGWNALGQALLADGDRDGAERAFAKARALGGAPPTSALPSASPKTASR